MSSAVYSYADIVFFATVKEGNAQFLRVVPSRSPLLWEGSDIPLYSLNFVDILV